METMDLPKDLVKQAKDSIWEELNQSNKEYVKHYYDRFVSICVSHPAAIVRGRIVNGTIHIQLLLKIVGLLSLLHLPIIILAVVLSFWKSLWIFIAIPVLLFSLYIFNNIQTNINVELAARLTVLDELMEQDEKFRESVLHLMNWT